MRSVCAKYSYSRYVILHFPHRRQAKPCCVLYFCFMILYLCFGRHWADREPSLIILSPLCRNSSSIQGRLSWNDAACFSSGTHEQCGLSLSKSNPFCMLRGYVGFLSVSSSQVRPTPKEKAYHKPQGFFVSLPSFRHLWTLPASCCIKTWPKLVLLGRVVMEFKFFSLYVSSSQSNFPRYFSFLEILQWNPSQLRNALKDYLINVVF